MTGQGLARLGTAVKGRHGKVEQGEVGYGWQGGVSNGAVMFGAFGRG